MKIGINGFGRIGKLVYQICIERGIEVPIINDPFIDIDYLQYTLKHDSTHKIGIEVVKKENSIVLRIGDKLYETILSQKRDPGEIHWEKYGIDIVIESSGVFTKLGQFEGHTKSGCKVIITAPSSDCPMYVVGVNHEQYKGEQVISNASCTTNCLAPLANILHKNFGIVEGLMTTVHAVTATQKTVDGISKKDFRSGRSALFNIIPASTGAAKAVGKVIPELNNKLTGMAFRVPVLNVSVVDLTVRLEKSTTLAEIEEAIRKENIPEIIDVTNEHLVSSDFNTDKRSSIVDIGASIALNSNFFKIISWYDNEYGYSNRVVDLAEYIFKK
ncbi:Glyceraldehyde-3-phosphate dehydrogenase [Dictyocoela muelleri]|nr:Glyceraldehyde-3-phosphate dehydrogenase [Dictyocoela muelleri]